MLIPLLKNLFDINCISDSSDFELRYRMIPITKNALFSITRTALEALVILKSNEISFHNISDALLKNLPGELAAKKGRIDCTWLVCSERGGIYLFEAIATRENSKRGKLRNKFRIVNSCDGTVSFGPGHIKNNEYTDRMRGMIDSYRFGNPDEWNADFRDLVSAILEV